MFVLNLYKKRSQLESYFPNWLLLSKTLLRNLRADCVRRSSLRRAKAEREGFEPSVPVSQYDSLANCSFRPLRHLSVFLWSANVKKDFLLQSKNWKMPASVGKKNIK